MGPLQLAQKELDQLRADIDRDTKDHDDRVASVESANSQLRQEVESLEEEVKDRDAQIAKLQLLHRLKNRVGELQRNIEKRDSIIAEIDETPLTDIDRLKKRLDRYKQKVEQRDATIAEFVQTMVPKLCHLKLAVSCADYDYEARTDLNDNLEEANDLTGDLGDLVDSYMREINADQAKLNAKINNIDRLVKGLQKEGKVYYNKIAKPKKFIRQVHEKLQNRKTTVERLRDELKAGGAKYASPNSDDYFS
uniref:Myosin heavy chain n=1 Tax=Panagrellus redivivus TaxID=6233 RepID=A0A7E4ZVQ5_PANRE